jgi:hypothetical protein
MSPRPASTPHEPTAPAEKPSSTHEPSPAEKPAPTGKPSSASPEPAATGWSGSGGRLFAANPEQLDKGAKRIGGISDALDDATKLTKNIKVEAVGHGPIAKAISEQYVPAKTGLDDLLTNLMVLSAGLSDSTSALAKTMRNVNDGTVEQAQGMGSP